MVINKWLCVFFHIKGKISKACGASPCFLEIKAAVHKLYEPDIQLYKWFVLLQKSSQSHTAEQRKAIPRNVKVCQGVISLREENGIIGFVFGILIIWRPFQEMSQFVKESLVWGKKMKSLHSCLEFWSSKGHSKKCQSCQGVISMREENKLIGFVFGILII